MEGAFLIVVQLCRSDVDAKAELHQRTEDLRELLWEIADTNRDEANKDRQAIMDNRWAEDHSLNLINLFIQIMQAEADRFMQTKVFLSDFARDTSGMVRNLSMTHTVTSLTPQPLDDHNNVALAPPPLIRLPTLDGGNAERDGANVVPSATSIPAASNVTPVPQQLPPAPTNQSVRKSIIPSTVGSASVVPINTSTTIPTAAVTLNPTTGGTKKAASVAPVISFSKKDFAGNSFPTQGSNMPMQNQNPSEVEILSPEFCTAFTVAMAVATDDDESAENRDHKEKSDKRKTPHSTVDQIDPSKGKRQFPLSIFIP